MGLKVTQFILGLRSRSYIENKQKKQQKAQLLRHEKMKKMKLVVM